MKRSRLLVPSLAACCVGALLVLAGAGSAQTGAPTNSSPPSISGTAQVGQLLKTNNGTWNGSTPMTFTYQWRICNNTGGACHDISGATGNEYSVKSGDQGNTLRAVVTARNSSGSASAASVPSAVISAAPKPTPAPAPTGCPKLAAGATSAAVADVSPPARLLIDQMQSSPSVITRGTAAFTVRVHVTSTCGNPVSGASIYLTGVPYNMVSVAHGTSDANGWATMSMSTLKGFPATPNQERLVMFARASKTGENVLAGVSARRLISFHVNLHG
jgi:hypothetical protein